jgi:hypothetical protein
MESRTAKHIRTNMEAMKTAQLLKIWIHNDTELYSDEAFKIIKEVLISRNVKPPLHKEVKYCQICSKRNNLNQRICKCGYNFVENNIDDILFIKAKRRKKNRFTGMLMVLGGIIWILSWWPSYSPGIYKIKSHTNQWILGIPFFMILIGLYRLIFAVAVKAPTKSVFDHILGDKNAKEDDDDIDFILCPSCGKQLFEEMNHRVCPYCEKSLKNKGYKK